MLLRRKLEWLLQELQVVLQRALLRVRQLEGDLLNCYRRNDGGTGSNTGLAMPSKTSGTLKDERHSTIWSCAIAAVLRNVALL
jgi:hypothetical protein